MYVCTTEIYFLQKIKLALLVLVATKKVLRIPFPPFSFNVLLIPQ